MRPVTLAIVVGLGVLSLGPGTVALANPADTTQGAIEGTVIAVAEDGSLGAWALESLTPLATIRKLSPALSDIRLVNLPVGNAIAPESPVRLQFGGLDRTYVSLFRYHPDGHITLLLKNQHYNKLEAKTWLMDVTADSAEGAETYLSITSRTPLGDGDLEAMAKAPNGIQLKDPILGSSYTWYKVMDQTGTRLDTSGGNAIDGSAPHGHPFSGGGNNDASNNGPATPKMGLEGALGSGLTPTQGNPYYNPYAYGGLYNPFIRRYGYLPYYMPYQFVLPGSVINGSLPGLYRPVYDFGNAFYAPQQYFYVLPTARGVRTNFLDLLLNAGFGGDGSILLRNDQDFVEGEINLNFGHGFSLRLGGVRDQRGDRFTVAPVVIYIDGLAYVPLIDPNTGDYIVNVPSLGPGQPGGSRIRIQPTAGVGPVGIDRIEVR